MTSNCHRKDAREELGRVGKLRCDGYHHHKVLVNSTWMGAVKGKSGPTGIGGTIHDDRGKMILML